MVDHREGRDDQKVLADSDGNEPGGDRSADDDERELAGGTEQQVRFRRIRPSVSPNVASDAEHDQGLHDDDGKRRATG